MRCSRTCPTSCRRECPRAAYTADTFLKGDETLELAGIAFETLRVPGHSPGHLAFHADGCLFSGDVLFAGSVGRTDLPGADWDDAGRVAPHADASAFRPRRSSTPATARRRRSAPSSTGNPFLAPLRAS